MPYCTTQSTIPVVKEAPFTRSFDRMRRLRRYALTGECGMAGENPKDAIKKEEDKVVAREEPC
jgi:hypothetical protein